jgi:hypothetical protein
MRIEQVAECTICGCTRDPEDDWFLMIESRWQDKVKILQWQEQLAGQAEVSQLCSPAHVQELVVHWMTTGGLDYPFARLENRERAQSHRLGRAVTDFDIRSAQQIGELAIHRESIERILRESPYSLTAILDALLGALERSAAPAKPVRAVKAEDLCLEEQEVLR